MDNIVIDPIIAKFPAIFTLYAFPSELFRISPRNSYLGGSDGKTPMLYLQRLVTSGAYGRLYGKGPDDNEDLWLDFGKGTESELQHNIVLLKEEQVAAYVKSR